MSEAEKEVMRNKQRQYYAEKKKSFMQKRNTIDNQMKEKKNMVETISQSKGGFQNDDLNTQKKNILTNICHDENISHLKIDKKI